jgi:CDP-diacylglycerol--glycerol-3-phosphate 3-phosphatidyltransferase
MPVDRIWTLPNCLTAARILLTAALYGAAWAGDRRLLLAGFVIAFATDVLDGWLARRLGLESYLGMRLDSFADYFLIGSAAIWAYWLIPEAFLENRGIWAGMAAALAVPQAMAFRRLGKNAGFHLWSTKAAGWAAAIFFVDALASGSYRPALLWLLAALAVVKSADETLVLLLSPNPYLDPRPSFIYYFRRR